MKILQTVNERLIKSLKIKMIVHYPYQQPPRLQNIPYTGAQRNPKKILTNGAKEGKCVLPKIERISNCKHNRLKNREENTKKHKQRNASHNVKTLLIKADWFSKW